MEPLTRQAPSSLCVGKRRPRIVVTGYGSFGSYAVNPSTVVVEALASSWSQRLSEEFDLITRVLAVDYEEALAMSRSSCEELQADVSGGNSHWQYHFGSYKAYVVRHLVCDTRRRTFARALCAH